MYSKAIREKLEEANVSAGDRISVDDREGRLMPKPSSGDSEVLVLKLDSGYNIGVDPENIELVEAKDVEELERPEIEHDPEKPDILVLHTGGTIASRVSYEEGGVKPAFEPEDLVEMYPGLAEEVNLHSEVVAQMLSEDMEPGHWQKIAEKIDEIKDDYDGIIVGHGTDTMSYTGAALQLMLKGIDTGVLLVGAQRSSDRPSTDATMNMRCAGRWLAETEWTGIAVCMHGGSGDSICNILPAAKTRKMHTSRRDAFKPVNSERIGYVNYQTGELKIVNSSLKTDYSFRPELEENVEIFRARPGVNPEELEHLRDRNPAGVVIEGTGLGHMPVNSFDELTESHEDILEELEKLSEDAVVVMSSQCINGRINMDVYDAGLKIQEAGVRSAGDMHPELAYVKLMWSLGNADSLEDAEDLFNRNVAGEISERSNYSE